MVETNFFFLIIFFPFAVVYLFLLCKIILKQRIWCFFLLDSVLFLENSEEKIWK